jgi:hypothetical protein
MRAGHARSGQYVLLLAVFSDPRLRERRISQLLGFRKRPRIEVRYYFVQPCLCGRRRSIDLRVHCDEKTVSFNALSEV